MKVKTNVKAGSVHSGSARLTVSSLPSLKKEAGLRRGSALFRFHQLILLLSHPQFPKLRNK
jgi:hypothetical protein